MAKNTSTNFRNIANTFSETEKEETLETTPSVNPVETTEIPEPEPVQEDVEKKEESEPVVEKEPEKPVVEEKTEEEPVSLSKNDALDVTFLKGVSRQKRIVTVDRIMNIIKNRYLNFHNLKFENILLPNSREQYHFRKMHYEGG